MVRRGRVGAGGSMRRERGRRPVGGRCPPSRTTRLRRGRATWSRPPGGFPERRQVTPLVWFVEGVFVVGAVACLDFGGTVTRQQRAQRLIDHGGVGVAGSHPSSGLKEVVIDRGAQPCPTHATIMPSQGRDQASSS